MVSLLLYQKCLETPVVWRGELSLPHLYLPLIAHLEFPPGHGAQECKLGWALGLLAAEKRLCPATLKALLA